MAVWIIKYVCMYVRTKQWEVRRLKKFEDRAAGNFQRAVKIINLQCRYYYDIIIIILYRRRVPVIFNMSNPISAILRVTRDGNPPSLPPSSFGKSSPFSTHPLLAVIRRYRADEIILKMSFAGVMTLSF